LGPEDQGVGEENQGRCLEEVKGVALTIFKE